MEHFLIDLALLTVLGILAQWLAWRLHLPAILILLLAGLLAGPVTGFLRPDQLFGELLSPVVSLSVAVILFEGGLSLKLTELRQIGAVVRNLVSLGVAVTWGLSALAAYLLLDLSLELALLFGAILVVTGPTVIIPLLRQINPARRIGIIAKWEGIIIDPIGATLAVLVFESLLTGNTGGGPFLVLSGLLRTVLFGGLIGITGAAVLTLLMKRYWIPDFLHEVITLMLVISTYTVSDLLQRESGLLAVTVLGIGLANQKWVPVKHIITFKENLRVLLISGLFVLLAARLRTEDLASIGLNEIAFLAVLVLIVRPIAVQLSAFGSDLNGHEKIFLSWLAPRGIVAAAVSSVFALSLAESGIAGAERLIPLTFMVIIGTVTLYGLSAPLLARRLSLANANPQGALIVGAHDWARRLGLVLKEEGFETVLVDTNWDNLRDARMSGLRTFHGSVLSDSILDDIDLFGIGRLIALTPNDEVNALAALHFEEIFDKSEVYQLACAPTEGRKTEVISAHQRGRLLFGTNLGYAEIGRRIRAKQLIKKTRLTDEFDYQAFTAKYQDAALLFIITESRTLLINTTDRPLTPKKGHTLIILTKNPE